MHFPLLRMGRLVGEKTEKDFVVVPLEYHIVIHGQFGNIRNEIRKLQRMLIDAGLPEYVPYVETIHVELEFLEKYYPRYNHDSPF